MSDKRFKSLDDLCSLLVDERNLACRDRDELKRFLSRTNYYRFSGYAREFQIDPRYGDDRFIGGASFEEIREIAEIDSKMRALLLEQLSVVEIAMRAMLAAHSWGSISSELKAALIRAVDCLSHVPTRPGSRVMAAAELMRFRLFCISRNPRTFPAIPLSKESHQTSSLLSASRPITFSRTRAPRVPFSPR